ncbi:hypothetical protein SAMN04489761_0361 [Tenacibaculum sp. MAR_2009_124]|uniref:hypothetical protein n=1 Tax=Tenacibaculum sp. MAR_2009_124 TaxID=1250059 RepID=UPI0008997C54|nr:hypothetical protein [Tenacibaculum sp. MAR_2009_124]SEB38793.1 hypothetical protein SAMN04489761_0361 [Tenacibaculum sp. MAR_2009_124]
MKFSTEPLIALFLVLFSFQYISAQIDANSLFALPRATNTEMLGITAPNTGSLLYNTDDNSIYKFNGTNWSAIDDTAKLKSIILNRDGGYSLPNATNTYYNFPINNSHVQYIDNDVFQVVSNGTIRVLKTGIYMISAELSTSNMPVGNTKYIIAAFRNNNLIAYLNRGSVSLTNQDWWGSTGVVMYNLNANDQISLRYVLNAGGTLNGRLINIGITKMN